MQDLNAKQINLNTSRNS